MAKNSTYVIGCKLPNGLSFRHDDKVITLAGANSSALVNGFGMTKDVPADAWEAFEKNHADSKFIKNGIVFAVSDEKSLADASLERENVKTGLEQASKESANVKEDKGG
ncbi:hypothetical protein LU631_02690 [Erwinia tracheiphila]|uniref:Uncharacterized protein n=1 Tax=Erwinia tracheiphila TaxID=65700 RepID=A0A0M2KI70_9GAMM|nr:hypothetical protein [Erwinia tracheiphila]EOS94712.1 hypothetical protein ETR_12078 [Erwinia tracheiphila PSU-1]KKF37007.1 hypothetical protein SY86_18760 [Erwinia tracheiphila]UIA88355.1 hypothetical protein LU631_02690 [Erwinia tracheiphila]UIA96224.1 hypothetical protein LU633_23470 [Erwinia tracheiphila]